MHNSRALLEDSLLVSYKGKHSFTIQPSSHAPWYLPKWVENYVKNLHTDVYSSVIHNSPNVDAIKMSFNRWMDKLWYIHTVEYYSAIKRNELSKKRTWKKLKCILLNKRSHAEKATYCIIPTMKFWKRQNYRDSKMVGGSSKRRDRWIGGVQGIFRAEKLFCLYCNNGWHDIMYLSNPLYTECTTQRVNLNVNYRL